MSYQVLARKWRPGSFPQMVGQEHVLRALINALDNDRLHHAFLFTGTRGVGKTTVARILAKSLNCEQGVSSQPCGKCSACTEIDQGRFVDLIEVDAASRTKVEDTRELLENVQYSPSRGRYKVYLIDEVHMLSNHSFNALLKTLEEPPPHVKFLFATTDPQKLPVTILSRCLQFSLKRLSLELIQGRLDYILQQEGVDFEPAALLEIARAADGSMRDALSLLDQAIAFGGGALQTAEVQAMLGSIDRGQILALLEALTRLDADALYQVILQLHEMAPDYEQVLKALNSTLQRIALAQQLPQAIDDADGLREAILGLAAKFSVEDVQLFYQIGVQGMRDLPFSPDPRSGFEMTLLRMLAFRPDVEEGGRQAPPAAKPQQASASQNAPRQAQPQSQPSSAPQAGAAPAAHAPDQVEDTRPEPAAEYQPQAAPEPPPQQPVPAGVAEAAKPFVTDDPWTDLVEKLGLKGFNLQFALNCSILEKTEDHLQLAFAREFESLYSDKREKCLKEALEAYWGRPVRLSIELQSVEGVTPREVRENRAEVRQHEAEQSIEQDENVQGLMQRFSAQVEHDSIRPKS